MSECQTTFIVDKGGSKQIPPSTKYINKRDTESWRRGSLRPPIRPSPNHSSNHSFNHSSNHSSNYPHSLI